MPSSRVSRSPLLMSPDESALLVVDLQERLLAAQGDAERIVWNARRLAQAAAALGVRRAATEQAPEKLGPTVAPLAELLPPRLPKADFSAGACVDLLEEWSREGVRSVVLAGIETHVCIAQTALDLLSAGFEPHVAVDAVGSRFAVDHQTALRRLEGSAVTLTTTEATLFEWCESSANPAFREISKLAKEGGP
ncbi:isochorismatase family protein [Botrimarina sp.]|uniref:isochorismatase family protein n=1 Tax=Botrimarina sp. TaxID=2795802 RepID=UPI0032EC2CFE